MHSNGTVDFFRDLGLSIRETWGRSDLDVRAFPDIAAAALARRPPSAYADPMDVVRWVHGAPMIVDQADLSEKFGQPPITVFACQEFHIDVLFWVDGTTTIHQHAFSGAFHVMAGASLESTFEFEVGRRYNDHLLTGRLQSTGFRLRDAGDVAPIRPGSQFIHALFHLERPSVSVVVRTRRDPLAGPQYAYSRAGLAYDPFVRPELLERRLQTLKLLQDIDSPELASITLDSVRRADAFLAFGILDRMSSFMPSHERYVALVRSVAPAHAELVELLVEHAEERRREREVIARRQHTREKEHRFFLALLLNLHHREAILDIVRRALPNVTPVDAILGWLRDFARLDAINAFATETAGTKATPILDVPLDERSLGWMREVLAGNERPHGHDQRLHKLRESLLLRPLFSAGDASCARTE
jgi:hypothetical protein